MEDSYDEEPLTTKLLKKRKKNRPHQIGCTATIIMKEVIYYPEFQLYEHTKNHRMANARQLKDNLRAKSPVQKDRIIYVTVPAPSDHFGHHVGMTVTKNTKKIYIKNDFYGNTEPGPSKKVYYPVKQEKIIAGSHVVSKNLKMDDDDTEAKAKEVREMLQSIMGLTYKPGTPAAFGDLLKDLLEAKLKYKNTIDSLLNVDIGPTALATFAPTHQLLTVQPALNAKGGEDNCQTVTVATGWQNRVNTSIPVVAVATLPVSVATSAASGIGAAIPGPLTSSSDTNNQETSIFIEAMEAIFNSQM